MMFLHKVSRLPIHAAETITAAQICAAATPMSSHRLAYDVTHEPKPVPRIACLALTYY